MVSVTTFILWALFADCLTAYQRGRRRFNSNNVRKRQVTPRSRLTPDESLIINSFDNNSISDWSYYYTHRVHIAGEDVDEAQWTADRFAEAGIPSRLDTYNVFLNYPVSKSLVITYANGSTFEFDLEEAVLAKEPTTGRPDRIPTFHGYSASGEVEAEYVYVGRGQMEDFDRLVELGIPLEGKIALSMYGGPFRGLKVKNSQDYGMIGTVIFTDPVDDGEVTVANGYVAYPDGPARNPTSVQRGSVEFLSTYSGDPTTPGYPSIGNPPRTNGSAVLPQIPSLPISYQNAQPILAALNGSGASAKKVNRDDWVGALDADYSSGPAHGVKLSLKNEMRDTIGEIANAIGIINGTDPTQTLLVGNHRDAWILGGAADPNSGTAVLVELAYVLGKLLATGWQPRTNIVLCSWDAEEYGLLGSTEWMEEFIPWLSESAVAYLNVDIAVDGPVPYIAATPELHEVAIDTMKKVMWITGNQTLYDTWIDAYDGEVGVLGSGSDYSPYLDHVGIASLDTGADAGDGDPVYHYHSNYDSYHWMNFFGDPEFLVHKVMGQYLTLLTYRLASEPIAPLYPLNYADQMDIYYKDLQGVIKDSGQNLSTSALKTAIDTFRTQAEEAAALAKQAKQTGDAALMETVNEKYRDFQRGFTSQGGLPNREFYQHTIFAPGLDTGYEAVTFPGVTEAITIYKDIGMAKEWVTKTAAAILEAGNVLKT